MNDLVSYNDKHNEANGENNHDGDNHNRSWNCGVEGPTEDPEMNALRDGNAGIFSLLCFFRKAFRCSAGTNGRGRK